MTERITTAVCAACLFGTAPGAAQTVTGTVVDSTASTRVAGASVLLLQEGNSLSAITDSTGTFRFRVRPGTFKVLVQALGYANVESEALVVEKDRYVSVLVILAGEPVDIAPIYVVGTGRRPLADIKRFERRKERGAKTGFGYFFDEAAIAKRNAITISDVIQRIPGVKADRDHVSLRAHCGDALYLVDGIPVRPPTISGPTMRSVDTSTWLVNSMIPVSDVAGIEVYKSGAELPGELSSVAFSNQGAFATGGSGSCGVIAIWTKR